MQDTTELELELLEIEKKYKISRDIVEKAILADKINEIKSKIISVKNYQKQETKTQKDVPVRIDHQEEKEDNTGRRGFITNPGNTFTALL